MRVKTIRWKASADYDDTAIAARILRHNGAWIRDGIHFEGERLTPVSVWHIRWPS